VGSPVLCKHEPGAGRNQVGSQTLGGVSVRVQAPAHRSLGSGPASRPRLSPIPSSPKGSGATHRPAVVRTAAATSSAGQVKPGPAVRRGRPQREREGSVVSRPTRMKSSPQARRRTRFSPKAGRAPGVQSRRNAWHTAFPGQVVRAGERAEPRATAATRKRREQSRRPA
jgi:hypothetical protein